MNSVSYANRWFAVVLLATALVSSVFAGAREAKKEGSGAGVVQSSSASQMRVEGERRFRANCGRCHAAPQKFPPRMMATVLRHMRVRATITAEDRQLILLYMTQ
jgi:cytochrome c5